MWYFTLPLLTSSLILACFVSICSSSSSESSSTSSSSSYSSSSCSEEKFPFKHLKKNVKKRLLSKQKTSLDLVASNMVPNLKLLLDFLNVEDLKLISSNGKRVLYLYNGRVSRLHTIHDIRSKLLKITPSDIECQLGFAFNNLRLSYMFQYSFGGIGNLRKRKGDVDLTLKGSTVVAVKGRVPKDVKDILSDVTRANECYFTVTGVEMPKIMKKLKFSKLYHESLTYRLGMSVVAWRVKQMIRNNRRAVLDRVQKPLVSAVGTTIKLFHRVCGENNNDDYPGKIYERHE